MTNRRKIAIIEDESMISTMYRRKFESAGYDVMVADNGKDGLDLIRTMHPDVVLLDLMMPGMNGDEVLEQIRRMPVYAETPVAILTNLGREEAPKRLNRLDAAQFIVKTDHTPSQVVELISAILTK